jgi:asparagine synthase (glutamine-hydrolysing)
MSGFVVGYGAPDGRLLQRAMVRIGHRGGYLSGRWIHGRAACHQTYLRADGVAPTVPVPVADPAESEFRLCFDGTLSDHPSTRAAGLRQPADEYAVLSLYARAGRALFDAVSASYFALVLTDGISLLAARDVLGVKPLYYGRRDGTLYFASELKALIAITDDTHEFPPGHFMTGDGAWTRFASLPYPTRHGDGVRSDHASGRGTSARPSVPDACAAIRATLSRDLHARTDFTIPTGSLLSGGLDSSIVACLAAREARRAGEARGSQRLPPLQTFSVGVGDTDDVRSAREVAEYLATDHHELIVDLDDALGVLPDVIYQLESFDPSLVRSAVTNYLVSREARRHGVEVLLSGEGADELFAGYAYLKDAPADRIVEGQLQALDNFHNVASLRLDRMNQCHSIKVVTPFISSALLRLALSLPVDYRIRRRRGRATEKWILRKAFASQLPESVVGRTKSQFSHGSGSAGTLERHFRSAVDDAELESARREYSFIRSKEEWYYFTLFRRHYGDGAAVKTVGQWTWS